MSDTVRLVLTGSRLRSAAHWMMSKPVPEDIDPEGTEWSGLGAEVAYGVLMIPAHLLAAFIEECEYGAVQIVDMAQGLDDSDRRDARATAKALETIAQRLRNS